MFRLRLVAVLALSALVAAGCGEPPEKTGDLPQVKPETDQVVKIDERLRGTLKLPVLSGVFTLRPDKSVIEVQRLQVSGRRDNVTLQCVTSVGSDGWWQARVDPQKSVWEMDLREGRALKQEVALKLAGSPGCLVDSSSVKDPVAMPLVPLEKQPFVYKGKSGDISYTLTLPANSKLAGSRLQIEAGETLAAGTMTCQQILGDTAGGASGSGKVIIIKPVKIPAGKKFKTAAQKVAFLRKLRAAQTKAVAAAQAKGFVLAKAGSPGDKFELDAESSRTDDFVLVHGIIGQTTSREPARLGGLWCGVYQGGEGYKARFADLAQMERVNIPSEAPQIDEDSLEAKSAQVLTQQGTLGVRITADATLISSAYPKLKPAPRTMVTTDEGREQLLDVVISFYETDSIAEKAAAVLTKGLKPDTLTTIEQYCEMVVQITPQGEPTGEAIDQEDQIRRSLEELCTTSENGADAEQGQ